MAWKMKMMMMMMIEIPMSVSSCWSSRFLDLITENLRLKHFDSRKNWSFFACFDSFFSPSKWWVYHVFAHKIIIKILITDTDIDLQMISGWCLLMEDVSFTLIFLIATRQHTNFETKSYHLLRLAHMECSIGDFKFHSQWSLFDL